MKANTSVSIREGSRSRPHQRAVLYARQGVAHGLTRHGGGDREERLAAGMDDYVTKPIRANSGYYPEAPQGQDELPRLLSVSLKAMVSIETLGGSVLGIDHQGVDGHLRAHAAQNSVRQQRGTELAALKGLIDRQSAHPGNRHRGITRKPLCQCRWKIGQGHAACGQRVVAGNFAGAARHGRASLKGDITCTGATPHILGCLMLEVSVQSGNSAGEAGSVMSGAQHLDAERCRHFGLIRRLCACRARFIAGASGGGLNSASANRCWSSTDKRMMCACSIVRCASSRAAATIKSLRLRPWISAARRTTARASGAMRASMRDVRGGSVLDNTAFLLSLKCTSFIRTLSSVLRCSVDQSIEPGKATP